RAAPQPGRPVQQPPRLGAGDWARHPAESLRRSLVFRRHAEVVGAVGAARTPGWFARPPAELPWSDAWRTAMSTLLGRPARSNRCSVPRPKTTNRLHRWLPCWTIRTRCPRRGGSMTGQLRRPGSSLAITLSILVAAPGQ